ncbi:hypothetical protein SAMN05421505_103171 [Sinosporangium album]|uniref:PknH-like extracellular domain-containing protein n=2 Tax=Sinosporangium album TaxID=504805 RepID=A0A1G7T9L4_9ACTN|nr:hypothetical protein SAMN05421505_103171 [Sinosporangium album]
MCAILAMVMLTSCANATGGGVPSPSAESSKSGEAAKSLEIERDSLPDTLPETTKAFSRALAKPPALGAGWKFDTESLRKDEYFQDFLGSGVAEHCPAGKPQFTWMSAKAKSPHSVAGSFSDSEERIISVVVSLDSPARSAARVRHLRHAYEQCHSFVYTTEGLKVAEGYGMQPSPQGVEADEALAVNWSVKATERGQSDLNFSAGLAHARAGGLVVTVYTHNWQGDLTPYLRTATTAARKALGL